VNVDEYFQWFSACGYTATGERTATTVELYNPERHKFIYVPHPDTLSPADRREAAESIHHYFGWNVGIGVH
jgi:hypothetical protein